MNRCFVASICLLLLSYSTQADWHHGKVDMIAVGYDGRTISIGQSGWERADCTCYSPWPNRFCLDPERESHDKEFAILLAAQAKGKTVAINIDEESCRVIALYEVE